MYTIDKKKSDRHPTSFQGKVETLKEARTTGLPAAYEINYKQ